jgi:phage shock protein PspC (stress-responsive transcriptional regulator)
MEMTPELRRSTSDAKVAGVCAMLADRWRVDPLLVRLAAILLALSSGIGLVLYAAAWLTVPAAGTDRAPIDSVFPGARRLGRTTWVVVLVIACIVTAALLGDLVPFGVGPAVIMAAVWYFGFYRPRQRQHRSTTTAPPPALADRPFAAATPFTEAAAAWQTRVQAYLQDQGRDPAAPPTAPEPTPVDPGYSLDAYLAHPDPAGLYLEPSPAAPVEHPGPAPGGPAAPPRQRRRTGRMHLIGWVLTLGALVTVGGIDVDHAVPFVAYPAAVLLALGLTFIIGTWLPRPRGLFVVALLLTLVTGFSAMAPTLPEGEVHIFSYNTISELPAQPVVHEVGPLEVDLSRIALDRDATFAVTLDLGELVVTVPPDVNVRVDWAVDAGEVNVLELHRESGVDLSATTIQSGTDPDGPTLTIRARTSMGSLEVRR